MSTVPLIPDQVVCSPVMSFRVWPTLLVPGDSVTVPFLLSREEVLLPVSAKYSLAWMDIRWRRLLVCCYIISYFFLSLQVFPPWKKYPSLKISLLKNLIVYISKKTFSNFHPKRSWLFFDKENEYYSTSFDISAVPHRSCLSICPSDSWSIRHTSCAVMQPVWWQVWWLSLYQVVQGGDQSGSV